MRGLDEVLENFGNVARRRWSFAVGSIAQSKPQAVANNDAWPRAVQVCMQVLQHEVLILPSEFKH